MNQSVFIFVYIRIYLHTFLGLMSHRNSSSFPEYLFGLIGLAASCRPTFVIPLGTGCGISRHRLKCDIGGTVSLYICKYTFFPLFISYIWYRYTWMGLCIMAYLAFLYKLPQSSSDFSTRWRRSSAPTIPHVSWLSVAGFGISWHGPNQYIEGIRRPDLWNAYGLIWPSEKSFLRPLQIFSTDWISLATARYRTRSGYGWLDVESRGTQLWASISYCLDVTGLNFGCVGLISFHTAWTTWCGLGWWVICVIDIPVVRFHILIILFCILSFLVV